MKRIGIALAGIALALATMGAAEAQQPVLKLCTGKDTGNYFAVGNMIAEQATGSVSVQVQKSNGSADNIDFLAAGKCDGAIVQNDALLVNAKRDPTLAAGLNRVLALYKEHVHLICNKRVAPSRIVSLRDGKVSVAIGDARTGTAITWAGFIIADERYKRVPTVPTDGKDALFKVRSGEIGCMLYTAGLNAGFMRDSVNPAGKDVVLVAADDGDFDNAKDERGKRVYVQTEIPSGTYRSVQPSGVSCMGSCAVPTVAVDAVLVVKRDWINQNGSAYDKFLDAVQKAEPHIAKKVGG